MTRASRQRWFWLAVLTLGVLALYVLREVLAPFVAGAAIAYLLDPVCDRLQRLGMGRTWATTLVTLAFVLLVVLLLLLLVPTIYHQLVSFIKSLPAIVETVRSRVQPLLEDLREAAGQTGQIRQAAGDFVGRGVNWALQALGGLISGGLALVNILSLIFITPVVSFFGDEQEIVNKVLTSLGSAIPPEAQALVADVVRSVVTTNAPFSTGVSPPNHLPSSAMTCSHCRRNVFRCMIGIMSKPSWMLRRLSASTLPEICTGPY